MARLDNEPIATTITTTKNDTCAFVIPVKGLKPEEITAVYFTIREQPDQTSEVTLPDWYTRV